jgi:hypothetical protein
MCTRARLVQAGQVSQWFGMPHAEAPVPAANFRLVAEEPAWVEVNIDPAAHGDAGLGAIQRGAVLRTDAGQHLEFTLTADVMR